MVVNPIAGMGGRCGLKGTDGAQILAQARALGAVPESPDRARTALEQLARLIDDIELVTVGGEMGESEARAAGLEPRLLFTPDTEPTTSEDTRRAVRALLAEGVDLILFAGGDGTARDVYAEVGTDSVCLGIPAGCKIHSSVYGTNARNAGEVAALFLLGRIGGTKHAEVMDVDEEAFRAGRVSAELYGYLMVPQDETRLQGGKAGRAESDDNALDAISYYLIDSIQPDLLYILGPGSTVFGLKRRLGIEGTLLGVDVTRGRELAAADVTERELLHLLGPPGSVDAKIVVTVIGGQGYIFGRGNQQLSARVIQRVGRGNIMVAATKGKVAALGTRPLLVDTGDEAADEMLSGYMRVVVGYREQIVCRVAS